jgi:hypothetical protein
MGMNPIYMTGAPEGHQKMRDEVALRRGFQLYLPYSEKQAAEFLRKDLSTLKRWRRSGMFENKFPYKFGADGVQYLGVYIADLIIWGTGKWPNEPDDTPPDGNSRSGNGGLPDTPGPASGAGAASIRKPDKPLVSALARKTFLKPRSV